MRVAFRADASRQIGTGHVMRCLTLARGLRAMGARCHFICRALDGHFGARIEAEGFAVSLLPTPKGEAPQGPPDHAEWAGVDWATDARDTRAVLDAERPDWLVLDHYAFDARWQQAVWFHGTKLMVLDDLADRPHACDLLLDQSLGRKVADYDGLVPDACRRLIGPAYALLRPEFTQTRAAALAAQSGRPLAHILISMGGVDAEDATSAILRALGKAKLPAALSITIVLGDKAPALAQVQSLAKAFPRPTEVVVDVSDMAARMARADLAIGAGGATAWERCALGLPTIIVPIAANQEEVTAALVAAGAALRVDGPRSAGFPERLSQAVAQAQDQLAGLREKAAQLCDGDGLWRVLAALSPAALAFRAATPKDSRRIWDWRAASGMDRFARRGGSQGFVAHHAWIIGALQDTRQVFRVMTIGGLPSGCVRLERDTSGQGHVSLRLASEMRGQGLAAMLLAEAERVARARGILQLFAEIHPQNGLSHALFRRAGYLRRPDVEGFQMFSKTLSEDV
ncbi:MAG: UDP-2,4-diacetamido-2,4,6-trideoxy-beta-L-altropyranose hydrolase [Rhodobacteraceae bacterium]|nr:UDP-2,4-diacetamido-2,4,6-trideoxy-beta-L-altropyranose hydrolase [Paracoccaceae bacterium]